MLQVGDVVELISGGPKMTVDRVGYTSGTKDAVWCKWFEGTELKNGFFCTDSLRKA